MSLKSRKRNENKSKKTIANLLELQKDSVKDSMVHYLSDSFVLLLLFILATCMIIYSSDIIIALVGFPLLICFALIPFITLFRRFKLYKKIKSVETNSEEKTNFHCKKVKFLRHSDVKFDTRYIALIFIDENNNKLFYVYPEKNAPNDWIKKSIKNKYLGRELEFICYRNTDLIKYLPTE